MSVVERCVNKRSFNKGFATILMELSNRWKLAETITSRIIHRWTSEDSSEELA